MGKALSQSAPPRSFQSRSGLRYGPAPNCGEMSLIRAEYIASDTIRLSASHTKTNRARVTPIIPALRPWLGHFPMSPNIEGNEIRMAPHARHRRHVTREFYDLRHSCASILVGLDVDLYPSKAKASGET